MSGSWVVVVLYRLTLFCLAVVVATGVLLLFSYRPAAASSWEGIGELDSSVLRARRVQQTHWWAAQALALLGAATAVAAVAAPSDQRSLGPIRRFRLVLLAVPFLSVVGSVTGLMLAWDQLALYAVTVGQDEAGFMSLFGDGVRFALIDGKTVSTGQVLAMLGVHAIGVTSLATAALALGRPGRRVEIPSYEIDEEQLG